MDTYSVHVVDGVTGRDAELPIEADSPDGAIVLARQRGYIMPAPPRAALVRRGEHPLAHELRELRAELAAVKAAGDRLNASWLIRRPLLTLLLAAGVMSLASAGSAALQYLVMRQIAGSITQGSLSPSVAALPGAAGPAVDPALQAQLDQLRAQIGGLPQLGGLGAGSIPGGAGGMDTSQIIGTLEKLKKSLDEAAQPLDRPPPRPAPPAAPTNPPSSPYAPRP